MDNRIYLRSICCCLILTIGILSFSHAQNNKATADLGKKCPENIQSWNKFEINLSNWDEYTPCFEEFKKNYMAGKKVYDISFKEMQTALLKSCDKLIAYYKDGDTGDDPDLKSDYEDAKREIKEKDPPKENPATKSTSKTNKQQEKDDKDNQDPTDDGGMQL